MSLTRSLLMLMSMLLLVAQAATAKGRVGRGGSGRGGGGNSCPDVAECLQDPENRKFKDLDDSALQKHARCHACSVHGSLLHATGLPILRSVILFF